MLSQSARAMGMALCACIVVAIAVMEFYINKSFWVRADHPALYAFCFLFLVFSVTSTLVIIDKMIDFFR
jgi:hypothetical protein